MTDLAGELGSLTAIGIVGAIVALLVWLHEQIEQDKLWAMAVFTALVGPFTIGVPIYVLLSVAGIV